MKKRIASSDWLLRIVLCIAIAALSVPLVVQANTAQNTREKTESPYFFVKGGDPSVDPLPLKATEVDVRITGVIADVTVVQHYRNEGSRPIEAKYVFPGSTRAAVYGMNVRIGDRLITAKIREKQQAKAEYTQAKSEGKTAALLEEHLPNVFQMNVANILPGDDIRVELRYTELIVPQSGNYQFVFPTVVGPRYNSPNAKAQSSIETAAAVSQPYLKAGEKSKTTFTLKTVFESPLGIKEITSPSHQISLKRTDEYNVSVEMAPDARNNNRDFILDYNMAGLQVESGVLFYEGKDENFFLAMVEPPKAIPSHVINPREYIFVVDISGSMHGFPIDTAKGMLRELIGGLRKSDHFNVMLFSGSQRMLSERPLPATDENIEEALKVIDSLYGNGSTELIPALRRVFAEPKANEVSRTIVIVTDGYVSVEREAFDLIRQNLGNSNVFAFGIGSSVNRYLIEGLARAGRGEPFIVTHRDQAQAVAQRFRQVVASPVLTNVSAKFEGLETYDVIPEKLPDVLAERPVVLFGKWRGKPEGNVVIEGTAGKLAYRQAMPVAKRISQDASAIKYLWARQRIDELMDQENLEGRKTYKDEITALGLKYNLLTPYTSFLAIDQIVRVRSKPEQSATVNQPLPMPEGVSNKAIGDSATVPSSPEPGVWGAMGLVTVMLYAVGRRNRRRAAAAQDAD